VPIGVPIGVPVDVPELVGLRQEPLLGGLMRIGQGPLLKPGLVLLDVPVLDLLVLPPDVVPILLEVIDGLLLLSGHLPVVLDVADHDVLGLSLHRRTQVRHLLVLVLLLVVHVQVLPGFRQILLQLVERLLQVRNLLLQPLLEHVLQHNALAQFVEDRVRFSVLHSRLCPHGARDYELQ
jgi:hypothetical protein